MSTALTVISRVATKQDAAIEIPISDNMTIRYNLLLFSFLIEDRSKPLNKPKNMIIKLKKNTPIINIDAAFILTNAMWCALSKTW